MGELRQRGRVWWIRYCRHGRRYEESARTGKKDEAKRLLQLREGAIAQGHAVTPDVGRYTADDALQAVLTDYQINGKRSKDEAERRIRLHLRPYFTGWRMAAITTADVRQYVATRQAQPVTTRRTTYQARAKTVTRTTVTKPPSNAEINRELTLLKRAFTLAVRDGKLLAKPFIPLLREDNVRQGFFEPAQFLAVRQHLPGPLQGVVTFAWCTGWRVASEVLPLTWGQVDLTAGVVRLEPHTTKNGQARSFVLTRELRACLEAQRAYTDQVQRKRKRVVPFVFHRNGKPIASFTKAWKRACVRAGCPGRLLHDFRRTACRNLTRAGVSQSVAMELVGMQTPAIFRRYRIVDHGDLVEAAAKLDALTGTILGQSAVPA